jgi:hypothetical protein
MGRSKSGEGLARVNDLRDAALKLIKAFGQWEAVTVTTGESYFQTTNVGLLRLSYRTPFQKLPGATERLRYLAAVHKLEIPENLSYGLDVWSGKKVLNIEWNESETRIVSFRRGQWESELLAAADKIA